MMDRTEPANSRSIQAVNYLKVVSLPPGGSATYSAYIVPKDKKFFSGIAGWKHFSGQSMQDILVQHKLGTRVIIESGKNDTGKTWPPFPPNLRRPINNTTDPTTGRNYDRVSTNAATSIIDNWLVSCNSASFGWPDDEGIFVVENKSAHFTHNLLLFLSGTECDEIDTLRGLPISYDFPKESWNQNEVNVASQAFTLLASGTKVFGPMPVLGLTHLKFLAYTASESVTLLIEQGIEDRAAVLAYRDSVSYVIPAGSSLDDEIQVRGKYVRVTATNSSGANPTAVELNMQMRSNY